MTRLIVGWSRLRRLGEVGKTRAEAGMTTAEYAVGTAAAVAFAVVLMAIVRSDPVRAALTQILTRALGQGM